MGAVFRLARGAGTGREAGFERGPGATGAPGRPHRAAAAGTTSKEGPHTAQSLCRDWAMYWHVYTPRCTN
jgi:hypothetical protein